MARPLKYTDATRVHITGRKPESRLQPASDRRAIVNVIIDNQGSMTLKEIDDHFGFDIREKVAALIRAGWLEVSE